MTERQPRTLPNPLWCERCDGLGYLVMDAEWEPYAVQCAACADRRNAACVHGEHAGMAKIRLGYEETSGNGESAPETKEG